MLIALPPRKPGEVFVSILLLFTLGWIGLYLTLHVAIDDDSRIAAVDLTDAYRLTPQGEFILLDPSAIYWVMGEVNATPLLQRLDDRTGKVRSLMDNLLLDLARLQQSLKRESQAELSPASDPVAIVNSALYTSHCPAPKDCTGDACDQACRVWDQAHQLLAKQSYAWASLAGLQETNQTLSRILNILAQLKLHAHEQRADARMLRASRAQSFFWSSPIGSAFEVLFFSLFGVLTNLLINSAEYLRRGSFRQSERWVAYTKLVYGPVLSWILVSAIAVGWFDLGEYDIGTYSLPLLAFFLGLYSRRTVALFDKLGDKLFGTATKSIEAGPAEIVARRKAALAQFANAIKPRNLQELRQSAFDLQKEIVKTLVLEKESQK